MNNNQLNLRLDQTISVLCEKCENPYFVQQLRLQKIPALLTGSPDPSYMPIPVFACSKCGHVNKEFEAQEKRGLELED